jgi:peptidoglycan/xylan/chitin deacetylase (PgdA/CDA1 family)
MRFVSPLLKRVVYPCLASAGYFRRFQQSGIAVITYHGVVPSDSPRIDLGLDGSLVDAGAFRRHLRLLKSNYNVISPEEMLAWCRGQFQLPPRAVLLTCDDGLANNLTEMLPELLQEDLRCLFFVTGVSACEAPGMLWYQELLLLLHRAPEGPFRVSLGDVEVAGKLGSHQDRRSLWWGIVKDLSRTDSSRRKLILERFYEQFWPEPSRIHDDETYRQARSRMRLLSRAELQQLVTAGMTIGAHTCTHPILAQQPPELARKEIAESRNQLQSALNREIWAFAYPFGEKNTVSDPVISMAQEAGFTAAFMNTGGGLGVDTPRYTIPRVHVNADMSLAEFDAHVSGFYVRLHRAVSSRRLGRPFLRSRAKSTLRSL